MTVRKDKRLIEDYIPIQAISKESSREKSVRKGHISTLHLWWARRPLVACRAAVYGAMVPAVQFMPQNGPDSKRPSLCRANSAKFIERLCKYPGDPRVINEAEQHILRAHAARLSEESGDTVTVEDIIEGRAPRPKILDMFAGGGAIPLEALRLGCDTYALDLNPVAHIIELCTLVYPQKYGKSDKNAKGCSKDGTWAGLAEEIKYWGENWVIKQAKDKIGDLYPNVSLNNVTIKKKKGNQSLQEDHELSDLTPIAYLWTRTIKCKKPGCKAKVPLAKVVWVKRERDDKDGLYIALDREFNSEINQVDFIKYEAPRKEQIVIKNPTSKAGNVVCPLCETDCTDEYVKSEGCSGRIEYQLMAVSFKGNDGAKRIYFDNHDLRKISYEFPHDIIKKRLNEILESSKIDPIKEPIIPDGKRSVWVDLYGLTDFSKIFTSRQLIVGYTVSQIIIELNKHLSQEKYDESRATAICDYLGLMLGRHMNQNNTLSIFNAQGETIEGALNDKSMPMAWDFPEPNPFSEMSGSLHNALQGIIEVCLVLNQSKNNGDIHLSRGSAMDLPYENNHFDAIITDPPYYDNVSYAVLSDFFYIWLKRSIGNLHTEHFSSVSSPKKQEIVKDRLRYDNNDIAAKNAYQSMMHQSFNEAYRTLKQNSPLICVYAHKTTLGWASLVESLKNSGFSIQEAWPIATERKGGRKTNKAALASSIFLVARKRDNQDSGSYEEQVRPELESIIKERVESLWEMGISGADLLISCVGAGLRAYTKFGKVEYANGAEVSAEHFLREVESLVLENIIGQLAKITGGGKGRYSLIGIDAATRFYIFWRFTYRNLDLDAGEAIIFSYGAHVELDGADGLSIGSRALVEKKKGKYKLRDFTERGEEEKLGIPDENGQPAPLIDMLHRMLWLMENHPADLPQFLQDTNANKEQLRLVAQMLAGTGLKGSEMSNVSPNAELSALSRLIANWKSVVDEAPLTPGQKQLDFWERK